MDLHRQDGVYSREMACIHLVIFDMDGVLVKIKSSWDYLHMHFNVRDKASRYLRLYQEGKIDFLEWMRLDTELWINASGGRLHRSELVKILDRVPLDDEVDRVVKELRRMGKRIALVSSGIDLLARRVARVIGAEAWVANMLSFDKHGYLKPGGVPIVGVDKSRSVRRIIHELGVEAERTAYVGDSMWDSTAMQVVGYPILLGEGDEVVRRYAKYRIKRLGELLDLIEVLDRGC